MSTHRKPTRLSPARHIGRRSDLVTGKAVVQGAEAYQRLLDLAAQADEEEGIRQGVEDFKKGRTRPLEKLSMNSAALFREGEKRTKVERPEVSYGRPHD
jgi:hypothetical protein